MSRTITRRVTASIFGSDLHGRIREYLDGTLVRPGRGSHVVVRQGDGPHNDRLLDSQAGANFEVEANAARPCDKRCFIMRGYGPALRGQNPRPLELQRCDKFVCADDYAETSPSLDDAPDPIRPAGQNADVERQDYADARGVPEGRVYITALPRKYLPPCECRPQRCVLQQASRLRPKIHRSGR